MVQCRINTIQPLLTGSKGHLGHRRLNIVLSLFTVTYMVQCPGNIIQPLFTVTTGIMVHRPSLFQHNPISSCNDKGHYVTLTYQNNPFSFYSGLPGTRSVSTLANLFYSDQRHQGTSTYKHNPISFYSDLYGTTFVSVLSILFLR